MQRLILPLAILTWMAWRGYARRRPHWTRRSWHNLATLFGVTIGAVCIGFAMAHAVDLGIGHVLAASWEKTLWLIVMFTLTFGGLLGFFAVALWFSAGKPSRQLFQREGQSAEVVSVASPVPR
jgi:hypothetical protein